MSKRQQTVDYSMITKDAKQRAEEAVEAKEWLSDTWSEAGGLISKTQAAVLVGCYPSAIDSAIRDGRIKMYEHPKLGKFVSLRVILCWTKKR